MRKIVIGLALLFAVFTFVGALNANPPKALTETGLAVSQSGK